MDAALFAKMLSDQAITDWRRLHYKYPDADMPEFVSLLKNSVGKLLPLADFSGQPLIYLDSVAQVRMKDAKVLMAPQAGTAPFGLNAMEKEISSTLTIENIDFSRDSVRKILKGYAPLDESEKRIYDMKKGLEFISDRSNRITEKNIHALYRLAIEGSLSDEDKLRPGELYRHDSVYIVGQKVEHTGLPHQNLPEYMGKLAAFIAEDSSMDDLLKAAVIHFYLAYLHPYFDGNGRMARLLHLWYLVQQGYSSALYIPLSEYVDKSRAAYYRAFTLAEQNAVIGGVLDVTPFLAYFITNVYQQLGKRQPSGLSAESLQKILDSGLVTEKEKDLWYFVLSAYGDGEFSTKQLEKDYGGAAYATIRKFVLRFTELGLLKKQQYGARNKYRIGSQLPY